MPAKRRRSRGVDAADEELPLVEAAPAAGGAAARAHDGPVGRPGTQSKVLERWFSVCVRHRPLINPRQNQAFF